MRSFNDLSETFPVLLTSLPMLVITFSLNNVLGINDKFSYTTKRIEKLPISIIENNESNLALVLR